MPFIEYLVGTSRAYHPPPLKQLLGLRPVPEVAPARPVEPRRRGAAAGPSSPRRQVVRAADLMSSPVITCAPDATVDEVRELMERHGFRHLPVALGDALHGIVSDRDIGRPAAEDARAPIRERMSAALVAATPDTPIREVARALLDRKIGCLPIISAERRLVGILTVTDILRGLLLDAPLDLWV